jgi:hypothetical protein
MVFMWGSVSDLIEDRSLTVAAPLLQVNDTVDGTKGTETGRGALNSRDRNEVVFFRAGRSEKWFPLYCVDV